MNVTPPAISWGGGVDRQRELGGNPVGADGKSVLNITPGNLTGVGAWNEAEIIDYLAIGMSPDDNFGWWRDDGSVKLVDKQAHRYRPTGNRCISQGVAGSKLEAQEAVIL